MHDPIAEAAYRAAEYGGGPEVVWPVPPEASIRLAEGGGHLLEGAVITVWGDR